MSLAGKSPNVIVYAADDNYAMQMGISICSVCENNPYEILFYVLSDGISEKNKQYLTAMAERYGQEMKILEVPDWDILAGYELSKGTWSKATYAKLFLANMIPEDYERVLWIDCDTCVVGDIRELFMIDMRDYTVLAVPDSISGFKRLHGFEKNDNYYNAGVMLINWKYWNNNQVNEQFSTEIIRRKGKAIDVDQSYINCVLYGKIGSLNPKYNFMKAYALAVQDYDVYLKFSGYTRNEIFTQAELVAAAEDKRIIHYAGSGENRPWFLECTYETDVWDYYLDKTPWQGYKKIHCAKVTIKPIRSKIRRMILRIKPLRVAFVYYKYGFRVKKYH